MPDVARILKAEMKRIAAKEVRVSGLGPKVKALQQHIRQLEARLKALETRPAAPAKVATPAAEGAHAMPAEVFRPTPVAIKRLRTNMKLTQAEFAKRLGVSTNTASQWETGRRKPGPKPAQKLQGLAAHPAPVTAAAPITAPQGVPAVAGAQFKATPAAIKRMRARLGLSQAKFAKRLGISHSAVYQLEAGRMKPGPKTTASIAALDAQPAGAPANVPVVQVREFKATPAAIKEMRTRFGLTQKQFAALVGLTASVISNWEAGRKKPMPKAVLKLQELAAQRPEDAVRAAAKAASMPKNNELRFKATPAVFKSTRAALGVSQRELAKLMGVSLSSVAKWEAGRFTPRLEAAEALQSLEGIGKREARRRLAAK
jgi:DNA-binding transcriptional regulator YiaG